MAINWSVNIQVIERASRRLRVSASRIETDAQENVVGTYGPYTWMVNADPDRLAAVRDDVLAGIWSQYQAEIQGQAAEAAIVAGYETAVSNGLSAREP